MTAARFAGLTLALGILCCEVGCSSSIPLHRASVSVGNSTSVAFDSLPGQSFVVAAPMVPWRLTPGVGVMTLPVGSIDSSETSASTVATPDIADRLSVLTFNMWHRDRPHELRAMAERLRADLAELPDFVMLQEVVFNRSQIPGEESTAAVLAGELGYHCHGTKRTSDREGVAIISRFPFDYYAERHLESQTSPLLLGFRRVSVMGEFLVPSIGRVRVVNVHFTNWGFESHVREAQLQETLQWMSQREQEVHADVTFLGGDFNIRPTWDEMQLITDAQFDPTLQLHSYNDNTLPTKGSPGNPRHRIDYIFVSAPDADHTLTFVQERRLWVKGLEPLDGGRRIRLSDHVPLLHEYAIVRPSAVASASN